MDRPAEGEPLVGHAAIVRDTTAASGTLDPVLRGWKQLFLVGLSCGLGPSAGWTAVPSTADAAKVAARQYDYAVTTTDCASRVGTPTSSTIKLEGRRGWHLNGKAPIELAFVQQPAVEMPKLKLGRADAASQSREWVEFAVTVIPRQSGRNLVRGEVRFVVCQPQRCKPVVEPIQIEVAANSEGRDEGSGSGR